MEDKKKEKNRIVADNICAYRKANRLTQEGLASLIDVSAATISRYENNDSAPTSIDLINMAAVFQIKVSAFFNENVSFNDLYGDRHARNGIDFLINYVTELSLQRDFFSYDELHQIRRLKHYEDFFNRQS